MLVGMTIMEDKEEIMMEATMEVAEMIMVVVTIERGDYEGD